MKKFTLLFSILIAAYSFAQDISTSEQTTSFTNGSHNSIVVNIPHGNKDVIEKELRSEVKEWGGKYNSSKGEFSSIQGTMKSMGDKAFDGYAKIIENNGDFKVAIAVDLGGAYMESRTHSAQYKVMEARAKKFAQNCAKECVNMELAAEAKILKELEKDKSGLEKDIEGSKKDIEDYKKKISDAETKISNDEKSLKTKQDELAKQNAKIAEVEKKLKGIK